MKLLCAVFMLFVTLGHTQEWDLKKDLKNIKVYTRGLDSTNINEFKAVMTVDTDKEKAVKILLDGDNLWRWNHQMSESSILKKLSEKEYFFWLKNDLPWPFKDRDHVSRVTLSNPGRNIIRIDIDPGPNELKPMNDNCIRASNFKGIWLIKTLPDGKIEISQQFFADPAGNIPAWLMNSLITTAPFRTFENLRELLEN